MTFATHAAALRAGRMLTVVNHHVTPAADAGRLERDLAAYLRHFDPVTPDHLDAALDTGRWPLRRPGFAPVFYDGHREHATVAAPVCEVLGITGWFLPVTGWMDCPVEDQLAYTDHHDLWTPPDPHPDGRLALTWDELTSIGRRHVLGGHTATHAAPEQVGDDADVERELVGPYARLTAAAGGRPPVVMAWRRGLPDDPQHLAFQAMRAVGFRHLVSATRVQRLVRP